MNSDDPRAQRTRARLKAAVLELAARQELATITMSALAKRAQVNRATVYLHYPDIDSLVTDAMEDAVAAVARAAALCPLDAPRDRAPDPMTELFEHVAGSATMYARMLGPHGSARFAARMRERLTAELSHRFADGRRPDGWEDVPVGVHAAYLAGALVGVIAHWVAEQSGDRAGGSGDHAEVSEVHAEGSEGRARGSGGSAEEAALAFWRLFRNGCQATSP